MVGVCARRWGSWLFAMSLVAVVAGSMPAVAGVRAGQIERVSVGVDGGQIEGSLTVGEWVPSGDGSRVVFSTWVDGSAPYDPGAVPGVYVRDVGSSVTRAVSVLPDGSLVGARIVGVSRDGSRVVFAVAGERAWLLYVRDVSAGITLALIPDVPLAFDEGLPEPPRESYMASRWEYAFRSFDDLRTIDVVRESSMYETAARMGTAREYEDTFGVGEVYRFDVSSGARLRTERYDWKTTVEWDPAGRGPTKTYHGTPYRGVRSGDGRWSVFWSGVLEMPGTNPGPDFFLHDFGTGTTRLLAPVGPTRYGWEQALVSVDGRRVVLNEEGGVPRLWEEGQLSRLSALPAGSWVDSGDARLDRLGVVVDGLAYVYEVSSGNLVLVSRSASGALPDIANARIKLSADGSLALVGSSATNLVAGDTNNATGSRPFSVEAGFDVFAVRLETLPFDDVSGSIFVDDILWLRAEGITRGCSADGLRFCPTRSVTRGEAAAFLVRALELPEVVGGGGRFVDVSGPFEAEIEALAAAGITRGCTLDGTRFCPDDPLTRGEAAVLLVRALELPEVVGGGGRFVDVSGPFEAEIEALAAAGITRGCTVDGKSFCPGDPLTRGQMAAFLHRALADR